MQIPDRQNQMSANSIDGDAFATVGIAHEVGASFIPVGEYTPLASVAVDEMFMRGRSVRVTMNQARVGMLTQYGLNGRR